MTRSKDFKQQVEEIVAKIPAGKLLSYGSVAALSGRPRAARQVGQIAHYGNPALPWHRVIKSDGGLARGYPGGMRAHQAALEAEGLSIADYKVKNVEQKWWMP